MASLTEVTLQLIYKKLEEILAAIKGQEKILNENDVFIRGWTDKFLQNWIPDHKIIELLKNMKELNEGIRRKEKIVSQEQFNKAMKEVMKVVNKKKP